MTKELFRLHMPYCVSKTDNGKWIALNRDYKNLGSPFPLNETVGEIEKLIPRNTDLINVDEKGDVWRIFLYDDSSNPASYPSSKNWNIYLDIMKLILPLMIKNSDYETKKF